MSLIKGSGKKKLSPGELRQVMWVCAAMSVLSVVMAQFGVMHTEGRIAAVSRVLSQGLRVEGAVTDVEEGTKGGKSVEYAFSVNGRRYQGSSEVSGSVGLQVGQRVWVSYLRDNPSVNTLSDGEEAEWLSQKVKRFRIVEVLSLAGGIGLCALLLWLSKQEGRSGGGG